MFRRKPYTLKLPDGRIFELGDRTLLMGIINVTPDSFADGGVYLDPGRALDKALELEAQGANLVDVGGESTRPGAEPLSATAEIARVAPVLRHLANRLRVPISIDTYKADVARYAFDHGATILNDISALSYDPDLAAVAAAASVPVVLMHTRGRSQKMYKQATYTDVMGEVVRELDHAIHRAMSSGVSREQLIVDPGLGFGKRSEQTFEALTNLPRLSELDRPVLVGPSRKSFLQEAVGERPPHEREWGTAAAVTAAVLLGAHIVRVHNVRDMAQVVRVADRLRTEEGLDT